MSRQYGTWEQAVLQDVRREYPGAATLTTGETTGNVIIELTSEWVFKVFSPTRAKLLSIEQRFWTALKESCGPDYGDVFVPQEAVSIGGREGFKSRRFSSTLLDVILAPHSDIDQLAIRMRVGLDAAFSLLATLRRQTLGQLDPRFPEEVRLTFEHIAENAYEGPSRAQELLRRFATQLDRFMPAESCWCHRDLHLDNLATLDGTWLLSDPAPILGHRPEYVGKVEHLEPPWKGHVFLDYAKLLISLEREAGKLNHAGRDHPEIRMDRRAGLDRRDQTERTNLLLRLRREYERRAEAEVGRAALHLGYAVYYGLYSICPCPSCNNWGIKQGMRSGSERAINQLLADELALSLAAPHEPSPIAGGTQQCLLYEVPFNGKRAVLKIETASPAGDSHGEVASDEVTRNLEGYGMMPPTLSPLLFDSGEYERLPFLLMQHAGVSLREKLTTSFDASLLDTLMAQLRDAYAPSAVRDPDQMHAFYERMLDLLEENLTKHISNKHRYDTGDAMQIVASLRAIAPAVLPEWCFWTTTDFTVDNIFFDGERFIFIDPKEAMLGLFEIDMGMFPTLMDIYSRSPRDGLPPIDPSNVEPYRRHVARLAGDLRSARESVDCAPYLRLGEAWQCILSCRFRDGGEARQLYDTAVAKLGEVLRTLSA